MRRKSSTAQAASERKVGRTDPPLFMFQPLRTGVMDSLENAAGLASKVLTIVAPVGYGKTVLMSTLFSDLHRMGKQCFWFALDDRDTTVEGIIGVLGGLLNQRDPELHPTQAIFRGNQPIETRIDALIALIDRYPLPITLFIDNLNCCTDEALGRLLDALVFDTRPTVQLVLSSTQALPLDVSRAALEGLIRQLSHVEMSLNTGEVGALLGNEVCTRIGTHGVEEVARQTEGWPAAARMAQIILSTATQPLTALASFSGSDEGLAHLLNRQVLSGFPPEVRDFLLRIAQLRTFCLDLCTQATGNEHARDHLAYLLQRNVFVIPLDRNRNWYRLHGLFREFLLSESERQLTPEQRNDVLQRATLWCEKNGYLRESIDYALEAGLIDHACRILERAAPDFVRGQGDLLRYVKWIETLHDLGHQAGPEAEYWYVWALTFRRRYEDARQRCDALAKRIQGMTARQADAEKKAALQRRLAILRASIDSLTDRLADARSGAERWLAEMQEGSDDPFKISAAHCIVGSYCNSDFRFVEARRAIQSARESAYQADSPYVDGWVSAYSALIPLYEGDYATAYPDLVTSLATARAALGDGAGICGTLALIGAKCAVEMGLDADARQLLDLGMQTARTHGFLETAACGLDAATVLWAGAKDDAVTLADLRKVAACYPPRLDLTLSCYLVRRLLVLGRKDDALAEANRIGLTLDAGENSLLAARSNLVAHFVELAEATRIDLLLATGHLPQAEALIGEEARKAKSAGRMARQVELELDKATIAVRTDRHQLAIRHLTRAVSIATSRRIVRPFHDRAEIISVLVNDPNVTGCAFVLHEEHRFFSEICQRLPIATPAAQERLSAMHGEPRLLSNLTPRELELLSLIDAGLSNQQLADRLSVSLTTIKWHLQNLYSKLGVSSRAAALARGRALNLLPH